MVTTQGLSGVAHTPRASPVGATVAWRAVDRFGPATIIGQNAPPTVFVVYTARGTFSSVSQVTPYADGVTPTVGDMPNILRANPIQRGVQTSQTSTNIPLVYNRHGQLIRQLTLFHSGCTHQYVTGQTLLI